MSDQDILGSLSASDIVVPFQFDSAAIRGRVARLGPSVDQVLSAHNYPEIVSRVLGEALALTALLGTALKFEGIFTLQAQGDGPVSLMVADFETTEGGTGGSLRGYAAFDEAAVKALDSQTLPVLFGKGALALTIDQKLERERYQGIVPLEGANLAEAAKLYFDQSEQIPTWIGLTVGRRFAPDAAAQGAIKGEWRAGGLMVQTIPSEGGERGVAGEEGGFIDANQEEDFTRARLLAQTVADDELVDPTLSADRLLYRLFHEEGVRVFAPARVHFGCRCNADRLRSVLASYSEDELRDIAENGTITASCQFCSTPYRFALEDLIRK